MAANPMNFPRALVGDSQRMRQVLGKIEKFGRTRWPVLIMGETGTGKEVVARAIHSVNHIGAFVTIDCSSLVGPLMESELFGHVKGSFTGATGTKLGLIEMANGGTAFLDEIGELPLDMQSKLLRVLQEKEFRPVGSTVQRKSDFRVIAATNRDLGSEVEKGRFRQDLFYRLNVATLRLAPLRERKEDIPSLIEYFVARHGRNHKATQEVIDAMVSYDWPGNVRQLENTIQQMVAVNSGPLLHLHDLSSAVQNHLSQTKGQYLTAAASAHTSFPQGILPAATGTSPALASIVPLAEMEKQAILGALRFTKGDRSTAAELLGIGRTTLYRKLKEYNVDGV
ncbi:MAG: sigma-54 interaction domain-containing protein [Bryobacteraceae bacterium]